MVKFSWLLLIRAYEQGGARVQRCKGKVKTVVMNIKDKNNRKMSFRAGRLLALMVAFVLVMSAAIPQQVYAASMAKKSKAKYKVTVHNINSNTVLKKGTKIRISYTATKTKGGVTTGTKVKFKSSKKKVASVSKSGVIKAKKKGTTYITVYCKSKPSKKKKIKVRVGTPVSSVSISGYRYLRVGRGSDFDSSVNKGATNKSVSWWSDNTAVATVNNNGYVKAKSPGTCTIYATAKDGSGVYGTRKVYVHQYLASEANWIAHRGLHTSATENTAAAFTAAGTSGGFWGCECDIWETRRVTPSDIPVLPGLPEEIPADPEPENPAVSDQQVADQDASGIDAAAEADTSADIGDVEAADPQQEDALPDISGLKTTVAAWPDATSMDITSKLAEVNSAMNEYKTMTAGLTEDQLKQLHLEMLVDPEDRSSEDLLAKLFAAYKWVNEYDSIDLAINHNSTFTEIWGNGNAVRNLSAAEIHSQLPGVCFLDEYLRICDQYGMVPVIEFKDPYMSAEAINKALDMVKAYGMLEEAVYISFYDGILAQVKAQAANKLGNEPITYYLIDDHGASSIDLASTRGYTGVSLSKNLISGDLYNRAKSYGLGVGTWTYKNQVSDDDKLYRHLLSYGWQLDFVTVDYHIFR